MSWPARWVLAHSRAGAEPLSPPARDAFLARLALGVTLIMALAGLLATAALALILSALLAHGTPASVGLAMGLATALTLASCVPCVRQALGRITGLALVEDLATTGQVSILVGSGVRPGWDVGLHARRLWLAEAAWLLYSPAGQALCRARALARRLPEPASRAAPPPPRSRL